MEKLYQLAEGLLKRFPDGNEPYQMATRLAEECGEVASEISHWENSGVKRQKYGEPSKESLAGEIKNVLSAAITIAIYYGIQDELEKSINNSLARLKSEGHID
jgi:NTP pyrophosphatase (non-canonical NTP hydrolase)